MKKKVGITLALGLATAAAVAATTLIGSASARTMVSPLCKQAGIGFAGPLSGPAAFLGTDQSHWVDLFLSNWNAGKPIPGVPRALKRVKLKLAVDGDSQLNPQVAATVGAQVVSNKSVLAMVGFAGSNENLGGGPILDRAHMVYVSGSATKDELTSSLKNFFRVVPNNARQAIVGVDYIVKKLGLKSGDQVMVVDDGEAYGVGIASTAQQLLQKAGAKVDRESLPESTSSGTADFTALAQKAVAIRSKLVYAPTQVASDSQLFAQQLKTAGYNGAFMGTDGSVDPTSFKFAGAYASFFGPDISEISKPFVAAYTHKYGSKAASDPFGAPSFVAAQMIAIAISNSCAKGTTSRTAVAAALRKVSIPTSILGHAVAFDNAGDVRKGPARGITVFQIQSDGTYKPVFAG
jgi:branched-chain amino acid transport system substrate-binding protein